MNYLPRSNFQQNNANFFGETIFKIIALVPDPSWNSHPATLRPIPTASIWTQLLHLPPIGFNVDLGHEMNCCFLLYRLWCFMWTHTHGPSHQQTSLSLSLPLSLSLSHSLSLVLMHYFILSCLYFHFLSFSCRSILFLLSYPLVFFCCRFRYSIFSVPEFLF
jgi:hypothetical protein